MLLAAFPTPLGRNFSDFFTPLRSRPVNMAKRVCRDCPIPSCGVKYLDKLSNHLTYVHELDFLPQFLLISQSDWLIFHGK